MHFSHVELTRHIKSISRESLLHFREGCLHVEEIVDAHEAIAHGRDEDFTYAKAEPVDIVRCSGCLSEQPLLDNLMGRRGTYTAD